jgi:hypothetical protein
LISVVKRWDDEGRPTLPGIQNIWDLFENFWILPSHLVSIDTGYNNKLFTSKRDQYPINSYNIHSSGGYLQCLQTKNVKFYKYNAPPERVRLVGNSSATKVSLLRS